MQTPGIGWQGTQREEYVSRINRVVDYIEANLDGDLSLQALAAVALFSPYHFHRIFRAMVGETLNQFIQRVRIEKAASQLITNSRKSVTQIALDCGFQGAAAFARAFKEQYGISATVWRSGGYRHYQSMRAEDSKNRKTLSKNGKETDLAFGYDCGGSGNGAIPPDSRNRIGRMNMNEIKPTQVRVEEMPEFHVAYVRHIGPYKGNARLFQDLFGRLMRWAGPRGLLRFPETKVLIVYHDSPEITDEDKLRTSVCISVPESTAVEGEVGKMAIPAGKCALVRFELRDDQYQAAWDYVGGKWLPESGYQPDDRPCYELYLNDPSAHPEKKSIVEICLPVRPL